MQEAKFAMGQIIHHRRFDYRGVIFDVDPHFNGTDEWYEMVAKKTSKRQALVSCHVLVDKAQHTTYVAEINLEITNSISPVHHPLIEHYFENLINADIFQQL